MSKGVCMTKISFWVTFMVFVIIIFSVVAFAADDLQQIQLQQIQQDAYANKDAFDRYVKEVLKIDAKFTLLPKTKLEGTSVLVNPVKGKFDLSALSKNITYFKVVEKGGFELIQKRNGKEETLSVYGFDNLKIDPKTGVIIGDGIEMHFEPGKAYFEKTNSGLKVTGQGKIIVDGKPYSFNTAKYVYFNIQDNKVISFAITGTKNNPTIMTIGKDKVSIDKGIFTYYNDLNQYYKVDGNKMTKQGKQFLISQKEDGSLVFNDYYIIDNDNLKVTPNTFFNDPSETKLSYSYAGKSISLPSMIAKSSFQEYESIADLFYDSGYGSGIKNKNARKAFYEKVFAGESYRGTAYQNIKLLNSLKSGQLKLYPAKDIIYEQTSSGYDVIQRDTQEERVVERRPAISAQPQVLLPTGAPTSAQFPATRLSRDKVKEMVKQGMSNWNIINYVPHGVETVRSKITYYYTCFDNDYGGYDSFTDCVYTEGAGITMRNGVLQYVYSDGSTVNIDPKENPVKYESYKRGRRAVGGENTLDIGDVAVPKQLYNQYKGNIAYLKLRDGRYVQVRLVDRGSAIKKLGSLYKTDVFGFSYADYNRDGSAGLGRGNLPSGAITDLIITNQKDPRSI